MGAICAGAAAEQYEAFVCATASTSGLLSRSSTICWMWSNRQKRSVKPPAKMRQQGKITFPAVYGLAKIARDGRSGAGDARINALDGFRRSARWLHELADLVVHRKA